MLERLGGHLEVVRSKIGALLELEDEELIAAVGGRQRAAIVWEHSRFADDLADQSRARARDAGLVLVCRCDPAYPPLLAALPAPPAVLHVAGVSGRFRELCHADSVAIVGTRKASRYGLDVAAALGRGLGAAGVPVVSGMALGIDGAVHSGVSAAAGGAVAVLPGAANRAYPKSKRRLHEAILATGVAVSEFGPGSAIWRWSFQARNRIIAGLAVMTVVVEAGARSGSLETAGVAAQLRRSVGAVPGLVTNPGARGSNALLAGGATLVRDAQDVLDAVFGLGARYADADTRMRPTPRQAVLIGEIGSGRDTIAKLSLAQSEQGGSAETPRAEEILTELAVLETAGWVRRGAGGRFRVLP